MTPGLQITGQGRARYALDEPMFVYDGGLLLGTLDPVRVSRDGTEVRIERFVPSPFVRGRARNFGPLALLEITSFLAQNFQDVQTISYSLTRDIELHGDGMKVASARSALLERIGAESVTILPRPHSAAPGNFVVQGVWTYTERNLAALHACLEGERQAYRRREAGESSAAAAPALRTRLRQLLMRRGDDRLRGGEAAD